MSPDTQPSDSTLRRQAAMRICAEATRDELAGAIRTVGYAAPVDDLRAPEAGLVMVRGRVGGTGRPFNLGEASVARAAVRIASGETGFAYQLGRDTARARLSATLDALLQVPAHADRVERALEPVARRLAAARAAERRRTAATRVNFFTLVRGED